MQKPTLLGIDTGGTFTDFVCLEQTTNTWRTHKVLSTPDAPEAAILKGIEELGLLDQIKRGEVNLVHGTTVATNAALEGKGVPTAYVTNKGLKDVLRIGRQTRKELYSLTPTKPGVPVQPELLFEINARVDANGNIIESPTQQELVALKQQIDAAKPKAVAINLLFSFLNAEHEEAIDALLCDDYFVSKSSEILPEHREYERGATTWINSWLGPKIKTYIEALQNQLDPAPIAIMQSSGLTIAASLASRKAVNLLLSGPAGGLSAAQYVCKEIGRTQLMTFDMGGTSTDVSLINNQIGLTNQGAIAGIPVGVPMADIHTIGAGGGSIAHIDGGGLLRVGPQSAGASPGPACYGKGGLQPTVTDANLILKNLSSDAKLADNLQLDLAAATGAVSILANELGQSIDETARGIVAIANEHMIQALRVISIQKGFDPRQFSLVCFGGAGGLHVCELASALEMKEIVVPAKGGVLSALGMITTRPGRELVKTLQTLTSELDIEILDEFLNSLAGTGIEELNVEGVTRIKRRDSLDLRYEGQTHTLNVEFNGDLEQSTQAFHKAHESQFGHTLPREVEILNCRVHLEADAALPRLDTLVTDSDTDKKNITLKTILRRNLKPGDSGQGPKLILDEHSTTRVSAGWQFVLDGFGNLLLTRK